MRSQLKYIVAAGLIASLCSAVAQPVVNANAAVDSRFTQNIAEYIKLRKAALQDLPGQKTTNSATRAEDLQVRIAERIRKARAGAKQGDICTPEIAAELKRLLVQAMQGSDAQRIRESLASAEPTQVPVKVNGGFPENLPLQSTPATLLLNLPRLPAEVEYRLVGRTLVLRDSEANVIIDFVTDALPLKR
jgi:hypothetical protein